MPRTRYVTPDADPATKVISSGAERQRRHRARTAQAAAHAALRDRDLVAMVDRLSRLAWSTVEAWPEPAQQSLVAALADASVLMADPVRWLSSIEGSSNE